jgi:hypothetical protein
LKRSTRGRAEVLVIALEWSDQVMVEFNDNYRIAVGDALYLCGAPDALDACFARFPKLRGKPSVRGGEDQPAKP